MVEFGVINTIFVVYAFIILFIGLLTNTLSIVLCLRKNLRQTPTYIFFLFNAILDIPFITLTLLNMLHSIFTGISIMNRLYEFCKFLTFFQSFLMQASSWILVYMCIERCLAIHVKTWRTEKFNSNKAVLVSVMIIFIAFCLNFHLIFQGRLIYIPLTNSTATTFCVYDSFSYTWVWILSLTYSFIPFLVMSMANCFLIYKVIHGSSIDLTRSRQDQLKRRSISISVILVTLAFILFTAPNAIGQGFFLKQLQTNQTGVIMMRIFNLVLVTYKCIQFVFSFKSFKKEIKAILKYDLTNSNNIRIVRPVRVTPYNQ